MTKYIPKVAAIHDLSGFGRCSLTVITPVLSVMGIQVCPIPTVILSTHTGGFGKPAAIDVTAVIDDYMAHWKALGLEFECLYSGYLGNPSQIDQVLGLFENFKRGEKTLVVVDPVMGDHGKLYSAYNEEMQDKMRHLIAKADVITPNLTEAYFLLQRDYDERALAQEEICGMLEELAAFGPNRVVVKGIKTLEGQRINATYDKVLNECTFLPYEEVPARYPGTGDVFTSVMIGYLLKGKSLRVSVQGAADFVREAVQVTYEAGTDSKEGILLESVLGRLIEV